MIFQPEMVKLIFQGKKTQTRRRIGDPPTCRYQPGRSYALQPGRGKAAVSRITISAVRSERLGDLTLKDAKREGFITTADFFDYWLEMHGAVNDDLEVWVITFELGDRTDTPRLLAARAGGSHGDYVSEPRLAMDGEMEAISEADTERYAKLANARFSQRSKDPLQQEYVQIAQSLERMRLHLERDSNREIARTVRALEHQMASLNRKLKDAA